MKEYVLVEFLVPVGEVEVLNKKLRAIEKSGDLAFINHDMDFEGDTDGYVDIVWARVSARIDASAATAIKLQDPFLAEHMRISYIPEDLKNKYRK